MRLKVSVASHQPYYPTARNTASECELNHLDPTGAPDVGCRLLLSSCVLQGVAAACRHHFTAAGAAIDATRHVHLLLQVSCTCGVQNPTRDCLGCISLCDGGLVAIVG